MQHSLSTEPRRDLPQPIPARMARLPLDARGYPVPYFVAWVDGVPDFRIVDPPKFVSCVTHKRCWLCGQPIGSYVAFVAGPMCVITRTSSEPPSHVECAEWAVRACPFLTRPKAKRREANLPAEIREAPGIAIKRNPGCSAVYVTKSFRVFKARGGALIRMGPPERVTWWAEGRAAMRSEVLASIESGLPLLREADGNDPEANREIEKAYAQISHLLPSEAANADDVQL